MRITVPLLLGLVVGGALISGCSGAAVDEACDVAGVRAEAEHMVGESLLTVQSVDGLRCSGDWAVVQLTVAGDGQDPAAATFIFERADAGWIMKTPEIVCSAQPGVASVPEALTDVACREG
jgi:hypothetical protein